MVQECRRIARVQAHRRAAALHLQFYPERVRNPRAATPIFAARRGVRVGGRRGRLLRPDTFAGATPLNSDLSLARGAGFTDPTDAKLPFLLAALYPDRIA